MCRLVKASLITIVEPQSSGQTRAALSVLFILSSIRGSKLSRILRERIARDAKRARDVKMVSRTFTAELRAN